MTEPKKTLKSDTRKRSERPDIRVPADNNLAWLSWNLLPTHWPFHAHLQGTSSSCAWRTERWEWSRWRSQRFPWKPSRWCCGNSDSQPRSTLRSRLIAGFTHLGLTAMTKSSVGPRPRPEYGAKGGFKRALNKHSLHVSADHDHQPVRKAKPARMASLFCSVSGLWGVMLSQTIMARDPRADSSPPWAQVWTS